MAYDQQPQAERSEDPESLRAEIAFYKAQIEKLGDDLYLAHMNGCTILSTGPLPEEIVIKTLPRELID